MILQNSIELIQERIAFIESHYPHMVEYKKALEMSAQALEKQMPIKAIITGHNNAVNTDVGRCPICNGALLRACDHKYCPDCGQKLDWEGVITNVK